MGAVTPLRQFQDDDRRGPGRPTKYDPSFCEAAEFILSQGGSYTLISVAAVLDVAPSTIALWVKEHPEFSDAVQRGRAKGVAILEQRLDGMTIRGGAPGQFNALQLSLHNRVRALHGLSEEWLNPNQRKDMGEAAATEDAPMDLSGLSEDELDQLERIHIKLAGQREGQRRD